MGLLAGRPRPEAAPRYDRRLTTAESIGSRHGAGWCAAGRGAMLLRRGAQAQQATSRKTQRWAAAGGAWRRVVRGASQKEMCGATVWGWGLEVAASGTLAPFPCECTKRFHAIACQKLLQNASARPLTLRTRPAQHVSAQTCALSVLRLQARAHSAAPSPAANNQLRRPDDRAHTVGGLPRKHTYAHVGTVGVIGLGGWERGNV